MRPMLHALLVFIAIFTAFAPADASSPTDCATARVLRAGDTAACTGLLVPSSDIRSLLAEVEALNARLIEVESGRDIATLNAEKFAADLRVCEDRVVVVRNTLHACEASKAPPIVECPTPWGGWPWLAAGVGFAAGGFGGWGVGRATCP
jgi:hypothetical protein